MTYLLITDEPIRLIGSLRKMMIRTGMKEGISIIETSTIGKKLDVCISKFQYKQ